MLTDVLFLFWILIPAMVANSTPVIVMKLPILKDLKYPADFYATFRGRRVLGDHKTIRGFVTGLLAAFVVVMVQRELDFFHDRYTFDLVVFGMLAGIGALVGDSVKSFFKRQLDIKPGGTWIPFDQIDSILGIFAFTILEHQFSPLEYLAMFIIWTIGHPISTVIGYLASLKDSPI